MNRSGPIIVIEDDIDDHDIFQMAFNNLGFPNEIIFFQDGYKAIKFLQVTDEAPFLIISDINMPRINGFRLRDLIRKNGTLKFNCIPYIFFTTASNEISVTEAYGMSVQGFFVKGNNLAEIESTLDVIMKYWLKCASPANFPQTHSSHKKMAGTL